MNSGSMGGVKALYVHLDVDVWEQLYEFCQKTRQPKNLIVTDALRQYLKR